MATTDECCAVCAEPLKFVAIARCGHAESCSKCALRLRAVLDDERCVICQQPGDCVFVTRSAGELTTAPRPEAFDGFKVRLFYFLFHFSPSFQPFVLVSFPPPPRFFFLCNTSLRNPPTSPPPAATTLYRPKPRRASSGSSVELRHSSTTKGSLTE